jgi:glycosyltransferase involved in cell wall biosynthesis
MASNESTRAPVRGRPELVSVIVPVKNGALTLPDQLAALEQQTYGAPWELVIADNGSTDATVDVCRTWPRSDVPLKIVDASGEPGSSYARNEGARHAEGELLAFCDADDVVDPDWLDAIVTAALDFDFVGGTQEEGLLNDEAIQRSRAPRLRTKLVRPMGFLPFAPTSNLAMWADVFGKLGGLDGRYRQAHDVEFSWRAQLAGYRLGHARDAVVHYRYRTSLKSLAKQAYWSGYDAGQLYAAYRDAGAQRPSTSTTIRRWLAIVARLPTLLVPHLRPVWVRLASNEAGRIVASVRFRVRFI